MPVDPSLLPVERPNPDAPLRLVCLPFAGGGAGVYGSWSSAFGDRVDVIPVQLPGRERRLRDRPYTAMAPLVTDLLATLIPLLDRPWVVFGHSMGASIGYALARAATAAGLPPTHLVVSARRAPGVPSPHPPFFALPDALLVSETERHYGPMPALVRDNPGVLATFLPTMRADYQLLDTWRAPTDVVLDAAVTAIVGAADPTVRPDQVEGWERVTRGPFEMRVVDGGHFDGIRARHDVREIVRGIVGGVAAGRVCGS